MIVIAREKRMRQFQAYTVGSVEKGLNWVVSR